MQKCPKCGQSTVYKIIDNKGFLYICENKKCDFICFIKKEEMYEQ